MQVRVRPYPVVVDSFFPERRARKIKSLLNFARVAESPSNALLPARMITTIVRPILPTCTFSYVDRGSIGHTSQVHHPAIGDQMNTTGGPSCIRWCSIEHLPVLHRASVGAPSRTSRYSIAYPLVLHRAPVGAPSRTRWCFIAHTSVLHRAPVGASSRTRRCSIAHVSHRACSSVSLALARTVSFTKPLAPQIPRLTPPHASDTVRALGKRRP